MKYCTACQRMVQPNKKFAWGSYILFSCLTFGIWFVTYPLIYMLKGKRCPICGNKNLQKQAPKIEE